MKRMSSTIAAIVAGFLAASVAVAQPRLEGDLPRGADLGFAAPAREGRLVVARLDPSSAAAAAGLADGDAIVAVGGRRFARPYEGADLLRRLDGGRPALLTVLRGGVEREVRFVPPERPFEPFEKVEAVYGSVTTPDGARLRTILTRPRGATAPLPTVFVTQWVSCDSIEYDPADNVQHVLRALVERSGMAIARVERGGGGDSEGPGCHELDYDTEVAHYRYALDHLARSPWVDPQRIVVLGLSLGSTTAPLVAAGRPVAGVIVTGAGALTYFERMVAFDRLALERLGDPREVQSKLLRHADFHRRYLLEGRSPEDLEAEPALAGVWAEIRGTGDGVHYGRPYDWHRQAARRDFLAAWADIAAPVLVLYAELDQFEPAGGHRLIADTVERLRPGSATFVELPRMGHDFAVYPTAADAMRWERGAPAPELVAGPILAWLRARGLAREP